MSASKKTDAAAPKAADREDVLELVYLELGKQNAILAECLASLREIVQRLPSREQDVLGFGKAPR